MRVRRSFVGDRLQIADRPGGCALPQRGLRRELDRIYIVWHTSNIFRREVLRLRVLAEVEFCRSLQEVAGPQRGEGGADPLQDRVGGGIILLPKQLERAQVIRLDVVRRCLEDRVEIAVRGGELALVDIEPRPAEPGREVGRIDFQGFVKAGQGAVAIALRLQQRPLDGERRGRMRRCGKDPIDDRAGFLRVPRHEEPRQGDLWRQRAGIEAHRIAQRRLGPVVVVQARLGKSDRQSDLALERGSAIIGLDPAQEIGELALLEQSFGEDRQIVRFVPLSLARGARLALRRLGVAESEINGGELGAYLGVLGRVAHGVAELDRRRFEISFFQILLSGLHIAAFLRSGCRRWQQCSNCGGGEQASPPTTGSGLSHCSSFYTRHRSGVGLNWCSRSRS